MKMVRMTTWGAMICLALIAMAGCAQVYQARSVTTSGFLKDYSQLHPGEPGQALFVYVNPNVDFKKYKGASLIFASYQAAFS